MDTIEQNFRIFEGPSRTDLCVALAHGFDPYAGDKLVDFVVKSNDCRTPDENLHLWVRITGVVHESGSGYAFNITGFVSKNCFIQTLAGKQFEAYYDARSRKGTMKVQVD